MMQPRCLSIRRRPVLLSILLLTGPALAQAPTPEPVTDQETELGKATYDQLRARAEIIESSPLYDSLKPIADAITKVAQPRYPHPFKFFLVHEAQPNAFATPGGNVYVVDSLLYFVKNKEQLAGTLCHEVSHTIHRDAITLMKKKQHISEREAAAAILLGPTKAEVIAIALLVRYFQNANVKQLPQLLSDHPANSTRITTLEKHFKDNPGTFSKFDSDPKSATPFSVPADAPVVFLRPGAPAAK